MRAGFEALLAQGEEELAGENPSGEEHCDEALGFLTHCPLLSPYQPSWPSVRSERRAENAAVGAFTWFDAEARERISALALRGG
jgi:hypothetical protein